MMGEEIYNLCLNYLDMNTYLIIIKEIYWLPSKGQYVLFN